VGFGGSASTTLAAKATEIDTDTHDERDVRKRVALRALLLNLLGFNPPQETEFSAVE
jgi:hypothetical protein